MKLTVIPETIYILGGELNCLEGHSAPLGPSLFEVQGNYYRGRIIDYKVVHKPNHGGLRFNKQSEVVISKFTAAQLESGHIQVRKFFNYASF